MNIKNSIMIENYIGITDFTTKDETERILDFARKNIPSSSETRIMIGVMMSYKTLNGIDTKWANVFPDNDAVADIFIKDPLLMNTLHYADYAEVDFEVNLSKATLLSGKNLDAIQLDMVWPDVNVLKRYRELYPNIEIVLQINSVALDMCGNNERLVSKKIAKYGESINYVLLDLSMGKGKKMDTDLLSKYTHQIKEDHPQLKLTFAGGLGPYTIDLIDPIIDLFGKDISIDAQGQLRESGSALLDPIEWNRAEEYLEKSIKKLC